MSTFELEERQECSAVVVLANLMDSAGNLNNESINRVRLAAEVFAAQKAAYIATTGWAYHPECALPIGEAMAQWIRHNTDIPESQIIVDTNAKDTVGDAIFTRKKFAGLQISTIFLVTSDYHTRRAKIIFDTIFTERVRVKVFGAPSDYSTTELAAKQNKEHQSLMAFSKTFAGVTDFDEEDQVFKALVENHPFYSETPFEKSK